MSTNSQFASQYHTPTTPETPDSQTKQSATTRAGQTPASASAPRTFEPTSTGEMPPMFDPEAEQKDR